MDSIDEQNVMIAVGIIIGIVGIVLMLLKTREYRTVGMLIFPLMPSIILFAITFESNSTADLEYIGVFGGPIAAYVGLVLLVARYVNRDINIREQSDELTAAKSKITEYERQIAVLNNQVETITKDHQVLQQSIETARPKPLTPGNDAIYRVTGNAEQRIIIRTGGIQAVRDIDVVVNSENTDMMLARWYERSMSGTLRYMDAEKSMDGRVSRDCLSESLAKAIKENKINLPVQAGVVIPTQTTGLLENGIRYVFHVATVQGSVGAGYEPVITQLHTCIENMFTTLERLNKDITASAEKAPLLQSILIPLLGAGTAKLGPPEAADIIMTQLVQSLRYSPSVKRVFILAFIESHREAVRGAAQKLSLELVDETI